LRQSLILRRPKQEKKHKLRQFIVIVYYYRDMWFRRSKLLARFHWLASHQARSNLNGTHPINRSLIKSRKLLEVRYKYFSAIQTSRNPFIFILIHKASDHQLGQSSCRVKIKATLAFYSRNLNTYLKWYIANESERELLSAIETCKEYKNILLGYTWTIIVCTYNKNNTFNGLKASDRALNMAWHLSITRKEIVECCYGCFIPSWHW
jgi:hypothetical protein